VADQNAAGCSSYSLEYLPPWLFPETFCAESPANSRRAAKSGCRSKSDGYAAANLESIEGTPAYGFSSGKLAAEPRQFSHAAEGDPAYPCLGIMPC